MQARKFTGPERPQRGAQRPDANAMHETDQQARDRVLGLSDRQSSQPDDIHGA